MLVVLAGTVALAWLIADRRVKAAAVELEPKPLFAGELAIRLPRTWEVDQVGDELPIEVTATEERARGERLLRVRQFVTAKVSAEQLLRLTPSDDISELGSSKPFGFLGQPGVIARYRGLRKIPGGALDGHEIVTGWYAATVVPGGAPDGRDLGVVLGVEGTGTAGPAGSRLIRQVADGIRLHDDRR